MHAYAEAFRVLLDAGGPKLVTPPISRRVVKALDALFPAYAPATQRNLRLAVRDFLVFCMHNGRRGFPATSRTVLAYVTTVGYRLGADSVAQRVSAVCIVHRTARLPDPREDPAVGLALRRLMREKPPQHRQARALTETEIRAILSMPPARLVDLRDQAILLVARDALARRSEVVRINVSDIQRFPGGDGLLLLQRSKVSTGDPRQLVWVSPEALTALDRWMNGAGIDEGPVFRSLHRTGKLGARLRPEHVSRALRRLTAAAGLDPIGISSHSCRVGTAHDLTQAGFALPDIMQAGGWRNPTRAQRYIAHLDARSSAVARLRTNSADSCS
ncbi:tyrosine-type recombinase/integrase [Azospirillum sp.]|uniref:tyrosine-type recombinase/integrase n=1 Tax=Azospirillum sp. TaxID=34012 RepID=UPI003D752176